MKLINCIACLTMLPTVLLGDEVLTLSSPEDGLLEYSEGSSKIVWSGNDKYLESWKLSYTLSFTLDTSGDFFYSYGVYNYGYTYNISDNRHKGISFGISTDNFLYFSHNKQRIDLDDFTVKPGDGSYDLSVSFITTYDIAAGKNISGNVILTLNNQVFSYEIEESFLKYCYLNNENVFQGTTYPVLYTNNALNYSNVELIKLDNRIVPEPASSVLLIISFLGFVSHRKRR